MDLRGGRLLARLGWAVAGARDAPTAGRPEARTPEAPARSGEAL